ncbi:MAG: M23 family metallopeptidase [Acutalibacteraceae bacterium]|nr:M23 family metallopeptidase [Acutalibacteraceae bacterium]
MKGKHTENKEKKYTKSFYAVLAISLCAIGVAGWFTYSDVANYINNPKISDLTTTTEPENKQAEAKVKGVQKETQPPTQEQTQPVTQPTLIPTESATQPVTEAEKKSKTSAVGENVEIISEFSNENLIYFPTLKDWRLHNGVDYAVEKNNQIYSVANGIVISVFKDNLFGDAIQIDGEDGATVTYYGIKPNDNILKGAQVATGDVLGTATGEVPAENDANSHIHIEIKKDGIYINPQEYIETE